jgi:MinD superfamily P-loop ATPase
LTKYQKFIQKREYILNITESGCSSGQLCQELNDLYNILDDHKDEPATDPCEGCKWFTGTECHSYMAPCDRCIHYFRDLKDVE